MDQSVPGLGVAREIVRWAFSDETNVNKTKFLIYKTNILLHLFQVSLRKYRPIEKLVMI